MPGFSQEALNMPIPMPIPVSAGGLGAAPPGTGSRRPVGQPPEAKKKSSALGIIAIPLLARITRANTMAWADRDFVMAARAMGAKPRRVLFRDVLPNVIPAMMAITLLAIGVAIVAEAGLAFLGLGVKLPTPSWGNILAAGKPELRRVPMMVIAPTIFIFLTVMSLNFLGDVIQKRFNVRESLL